MFRGSFPGGEGGRDGRGRAKEMFVNGLDNGQADGSGLMNGPVNGQADQSGSRMVVQGSSALETGGGIKVTF